MRQLFLVLVATFLLTSGCSNSPKTTTEKNQDGQLSLEAFFKNPVASSVTISPNGQWLASLQPTGGRMNAAIREINGKDWKTITNVTDRDIANLFWKSDDTLLFIKDFGGDENFHVFSVNIKTSETKDLTPFKGARANILDDLEGSSDTDIIVGINKRDAKVFDVYRINTVTGAIDMILENTKNYMGYSFDNKGELRIAVASDGVNNTYYYRDNSKGEFKKVLTLNFKESFAPVAFDKNNKNLYALSNIGRNTSAVVEVNPKTGKTIKTLYTNKDYDVSGLNYSKYRKELTGATYVDWKAQKHFFSKYYKDIFEDLTQQLPGKEVQINSSNKSEDHFVVVTYSDRTRSQYYTYDAKNKKLDFLLDSAPWIKESDMAEMKAIEYKSRDGLTIHGYLTLPKNSDGKNLPVVVNPHGGPWARDVWGYNSQVQFLASRGYAVFQMNFRGSTGYGRKFWQASFKQWGLKMQDDITDGVNWLVSQGIADKNRVAIYGGSYGGYATLAGLAFTPELYRCGVDYVGVSNIFTLMETVPPYWLPMREKFYEMIGHPEKEKALIEKASPLFSADKIKAPLFVAQGAQDPRVKKAESDQIVNALKKRGIDVPYLVKDNEGHGFRNEENRFEFYKQMEAFLDKHMTKI